MATTRETRAVDIVLETDRLILRKFTTADLEHLVELDRDPEVTTFLTGGVATPRKQVENEVLPRILAEYARAPGWGRWAAIEKSSGAFLGWFSLDPPKDERAGLELGYRLRKAAWGKGYATEGSRALVDRAFSDPPVQRVFAETMAVNLASRRVLEKAGLRYLRTFHPSWDDPIQGYEAGEVEYELRRADWELAKSSTPIPALDPRE
ncbi:MAG: GNAT family N-acetyltransferase [Pseudonocardiales bacterium]|nr:MAG: GNAT family N-acetyltransferase [Pseudonocardiales bacterium]